MQRIKKMSEKQFKILNNGIGFFKNGYTVVINCLFIQSWEQLAEAMGNAFQFPMRNEGLDGTWDWLTDLSWLGEQRKISIYLYNEKELFKNNLSLKQKVLNWFEDLINFWEVDVKDSIIAGKHGEYKDFNVYLI